MYHWTPVAKGTSCEAGPASAANGEVDIEQEKSREKEVGYGYGDGGADESPLELLLRRISMQT